VEVKAGASYTPYYYHADGLGSITGLSDATGTMVQTYSYDAFGNVTPSGAISQPFAFTGREYDAETSMYFYRARYYDPVVGRFVTRDPIGFAGGDVNLFAYVENSPVNLIDPDGLESAAGSRGGFGPISWGIPVIKLSPKQWQDLTEFFSRPSENIKNWLDSIQDTASKKCDSDEDCKPSVGTKCYEGPHTTHGHGPLDNHYHIYQMFKVSGKCEWQYLGGKVGIGVMEAPLTGMKPCSSYPNFQGRRSR